LTTQLARNALNWRLIHRRWNDRLGDLPSWRRQLLINRLQLTGIRRWNVRRKVTTSQRHHPSPYLLLHHRLLLLLPRPKFREMPKVSLALLMLKSYRQP
jgi:hypothetical protein